MVLYRFGCMNYPRPDLSKDLDTVRERPSFLLDGLGGR